MPRMIMTIEQMADRDAWLTAREHGIGGSEAAVIIGLNPWKSAFTLWLEKTGQKAPDDISDNERVYWGVQLEDMVAKEFCKRTGKSVRRRGLMAHDEHPYLLASVDRMVVGEDAGLECKTASGFLAKAWEGDEIPDSYYVQCQHYMMVTGCSAWYIAALIGGNKFVWKKIDRNEDDIKALMEAEKDFWRKVEDKVMPDVDGSESCTKAISERFKGGGDAIYLPEDASQVIKDIDEMEEAEKSLKGRIDEAKNRLRLWLGDAEAGTIGERKVTWKTQAGRVTIDSKRLKEEKPDVYEAYSKVGKPIRVLKIS